jgi:hypothetical protein
MFSAKLSALRHVLCQFCPDKLNCLQTHIVGTNDYLVTIVTVNNSYNIVSLATKSAII